MALSVLNSKPECPGQFMVQSTCGVHGEGDTMMHASVLWNRMSKRDEIGGGGRVSLRVMSQSSCLHRCGSVQRVRIVQEMGGAGWLQLVRRS